MRRFWSFCFIFLLYWLKDANKDILVLWSKIRGNGVWNNLVFINNQGCGLLYKLNELWNLEILLTSSEGFLIIQFKILPQILHTFYKTIYITEKFFNTNLCACVCACICVCIIVHSHNKWKKKFLKLSKWNQIFIVVLFIFKSGTQRKAKMDVTLQMQRFRCRLTSSFFRSLRLSDMLSDSAVEISTWKYPGPLFSPQSCAFPPNPWCSNAWERWLKEDRCSNDCL